MKSFKEIAMALVLWSAVLGGAHPALADDLGERRRLARELMDIAPVSDAEVRRDFLEVLAKEFGRGFGQAYTPYADKEFRSVAAPYLDERLNMNASLYELLATQLTVEELQEAVAFTRLPLAERLRKKQSEIDGATDQASKMELISRNFTPEDMAEIMRWMGKPAIQKYLRTLQGSAGPMIDGLVEGLVGRLEARCPQRTEPLPWCK